MMTAALAEQEPWWEPGTRHGYHALTFGYLIGEVIRRVDGRSPGAYCREEIARPLGIDFHIGLDARDDARCAEVIAAPPPAPGQPNPFAAIDPESMSAKAVNNLDARRTFSEMVPARDGVRSETSSTFARSFGFR